MSSDFEENLEKYAELIVKVGLNLQPGQRLFIVAVSLDVAPLVRQVTACAYRHGSKLVSVKWVDEHLDKIRYLHAPRDSFEEYPAWETDGALLSAERGDALMQIVGRNPELLKDRDPKLISIAMRTSAKHSKPITDRISKGTVQWTLVAPPTPNWATKVFPAETPQDAETRLWEAVFKACRLDKPDPVAFWQKQVSNLEKRSDYLTQKAYKSLHFTGPGTDLKVSLPQGHIWKSGNSETKSGVSYLVNIPTEEVFTLPQREKVEGTVTATKPLAYLGNLIENFSLTFSEGKVVDFTAEKGEEVLRNILEMDDGARFLGEVALVPHKTPISQMDLLFLNTLYDENASNHLALGRAYRNSLEKGAEMSDEEFAQAGGNYSLIHVDFMFGSGEMDVDGLKAEGTTEPVMRDGEWAFDV